MLFYHATARAKLASISNQGFRAGCYFAAWPEMSNYYLETIRDEGDEPVLLAIDSSVLDASLLRPDRPGIIEPITTVVRRMTDLSDEEEIHEAWDQSSKNWKASLDIVGTVKYEGVIDPRHIQIVELSGECTPLLPVEPARSRHRYPDFSPGM